MATAALETEKIMQSILVDQNLVTTAVIHKLGGFANNVLDPSAIPKTNIETFLKMQNF